jgi:signal transduction histidine kinase
VSPNRRQLSLRTRATIGFGLVGLVVSAVLAIVTYELGRSYLLNQREATAIEQTFVNARLARSVLRSPDPDVGSFLAALGGGTASDSVLRFREEWYSTSVGVGPSAVPRDLQAVVADGQTGHQRSADGDSEPRLVVGVPLAAVPAGYFEVFSLAELGRTLDALARALFIGAVGATATAALIGRAIAGRLVRPLRPVADAAERIAGGALDTRLDPPVDPDLRRLVEGFNTMAESLEARIERESRFAADVSHELRSPLAAVAAAVEVIERRLGDLPKDVVVAFEVLASKVETFQQMVLDLLEISRIDAGTAELQPDAIDLPLFLESVLESHESNAAVEFAAGAPRTIRADRRRLAQVLGNILSNANDYAGGVTVVEVSGTPSRGVRIAIEDRGPGIPLHERDAIFGRFARGDAGFQRGPGSGTGLGLALVAEHVHLHGGRVWVDDATSGGARFVIELPEAPQ